MKALEVTGKIQQGQLTLDYPLEVDNFNTVKVIILLPEAIERLYKNVSTRVSNHAHLITSRCLVYSKSDQEDIAVAVIQEIIEQVME